MNKAQAYELAFTIETDLGIGSTRCKLLGNNQTWIVIIRVNSWYCWNPMDYTRWQQEQNKSKKKRLAVAS